MACALSSSRASPERGVQSCRLARGESPLTIITPEVIDASFILARQTDEAQGFLNTELQSRA